jgi:hypothetical protein
MKNQNFARVLVNLKYRYYAFFFSHLGGLLLLLTFLGITFGISAFEGSIPFGAPRIISFLLIALLPFGIFGIDSLSDFLFKSIMVVAVILLVLLEMIIGIQNPWVFFGIGLILIGIINEFVLDDIFIYEHRAALRPVVGVIILTSIVLTILSVLPTYSISGPVQSAQINNEILIVAVPLLALGLIFVEFELSKKNIKPKWIIPLAVVLQILVWRLWFPDINPILSFLVLAALLIVFIKYVRQKFFYFSDYFNEDIENIMEDNMRVQEKIITEKSALPKSNVLGMYANGKVFFLDRNGNYFNVMNNEMDHNTSGILEKIKTAHAEFEKYLREEIMPLWFRILASIIELTAIPFLLLFPDRKEMIYVAKFMYQNYGELEIIGKNQKDKELHRSDMQLQLITANLAGMRQVRRYLLREYEKYPNDQLLKKINELSKKQLENIKSNNMRQVALERIALSENIPLAKEMKNIKNARLKKIATLFSFSSLLDGIDRESQELEKIIALSDFEVND